MIVFPKKSFLPTGTRFAAGASASVERCLESVGTAVPHKRQAPGLLTVILFSLLAALSLTGPAQATVICYKDAPCYENHAQYTAETFAFADISGVPAVLVQHIAPTPQDAASTSAETTAAAHAGDIHGGTVRVDVNRTVDSLTGVDDTWASAGLVYTLQVVPLVTLTPGQKVAVRVRADASGYGNGWALFTLDQGGTRLAAGSGQPQYPTYFQDSSLFSVDQDVLVTPNEDVTVSLSAYAAIDYRTESAIKVDPVFTIDDPALAGMFQIVGVPGAGAGAGPGPATVPEPASIGLGLAGLALLGFLRRRRSLLTSPDRPSPRLVPSTTAA